MTDSGRDSIDEIEVGILALAVRLRQLQHPDHAGASTETAVVYLLAVERYLLQIAVVYPVGAAVGNEMELDVIAVYYLSHAWLFSLHVIPSVRIWLS